VRQGEVRWVTLPPPSGSGPANRRPVVVVQNDRANASPIRTVIACVLTSQLRRSGAPGNVLLSTEETGLPRDSVANVSQLFTFDRDQLGPAVSVIPSRAIAEILAGIQLFLERVRPR
jgi:mRNA interferase MazF